MLPLVSYKLFSFLILIIPCDVVSFWPLNANCEYRECCKSPWIKHDFDLLSYKLSHDFFGQHLVTKTAFRIIRAHISNERSQKPLVLSFHGSPGTGKTFFSKLVADSLYKLGTKSSYVVFFETQKHFKTDQDSAKQEAMFRDTIEETVAKCKFSMFIIEEANLMNPKLLDVLLPYVNYPPAINGVDYNRAIFVLICNSGSDTINGYVLEQMRAGREREWISFEEMHDLLHDELMMKEKPFDSSGFVEREVVDAFIPFFPLEKYHVAECVYAALGNYDPSLTLSSETVDNIVNSIRYFPEGNELFSVSGCKRLEYVIAEYI